MLWALLSTFGSYYFLFFGWKGGEEQVLGNERGEAKYTAA